MAHVSSIGMRVTVLGCGTSTGVPMPGCECEVCQSPDPRNKRLRTSVLLTVEAEEAEGTASGTEERKILIDTSTDLRAQALRVGLKKIDGVLYTHTHADHVFGMDDLRAYNYLNKSAIRIFCSDASASELKRMFSYVFFPDPNYKGALPPVVELTEIRPLEEFTVGGVKILPIPLKHGPLDILGFRIGNFAYLTDCSEIPEQSRAALQGLDIAILDGLRFRYHPTHFDIAGSLKELEVWRPKKAYLTHMSHEVDYESGNKRIAELTQLDVELAYDGLQFAITL